MQFCMISTRQARSVGAEVPNAGEATNRRESRPPALGHQAAAGRLGRSEIKPATTPTRAALHMHTGPGSHLILLARNLMGWRSRASGEYRPDQTGHPRSSHPVLPLGQIAPAIVGC